MRRPVLLFVLPAALMSLLLGLLALSADASDRPGAVERRAGSASSIWVPWWETPGAVTQVRHNADLFGAASMFSYDARSCSTIVGSPGAGNRATIRNLRASGLRVFATVTASGLTPRAAIRCFRDADRRRAHVRRLVRLVRSRAYAGIDIDYEHLALTTSVSRAARVRRAFTPFAGQLCAALRRIDRACSITVMARWGERPTVWRGNALPWVYDYAALGSAATRLRVMAYDQHAHGFGPGPIAGYPWVKRIIGFTEAKVALRKVELGIPTYGRDFAAGDSTNLFNGEALALAGRHGKTPRYDPTQRELTFTYRRHGVRHVVWFSNPRAVADRTSLARSRGLAGAAYWAAGLGQPGTWAAVRKR